MKPVLVALGPKRAGIATLMAALLATTAIASPVSGVYVGAFSDRVELVQIVRTPDQRLSGRIEEAMLGSDGAVQDTSVAMDGAADGSQITLSPKSGLLSGFGGSVTGLLEGDQLELSWQGGHMTLRRGTASDFDGAVAVLRMRAANIVSARNAAAAAQARAEQAQSLRRSAQQLSAQLDDLETATPRVLATLRAIEDRYSVFVEAIQHERRQERVFAAIGGNGAAAGSAGAEAAALTVQMTSLHVAFISLRGQANSGVQPLLQELSSIETACGNDPVSDGGPDPCRSVDSQKSRLAAQLGTLRQAFDEAEAAYNRADAAANETPHLLRNL